MITFAFVLFSCGGEEEQEPTIQDKLRDIEIRVLQVYTIGEIRDVSCSDDEILRLEKNLNTLCVDVGRIFERNPELQKYNRVSTISNLEDLRSVLVEHEKYQSLVQEIVKDIEERELNINSIEFPYTEEKITKVKSIINTHDKSKERVESLMNLYQDSEVKFEIQKPYTEEHVVYLEQHKEQFEFASKLGKAIKEDGYEIEVPTTCTIEVQANDFETKVTTNDFDTSVRNAYLLWRKTKECALLEQHAKESGITWTTHTKDICLGNTKPSSQESKDVWGQLHLDTQRGFLSAKSGRAQKSPFLESDSKDYYVGVLLYYVWTGNDRVPLAVVEKIWKHLSKKGEFLLLKEPFFTELLSSGTYIRDFFEEKIEVANSIRDDHNKFLILSEIALEMSHSRLNERSREIFEKSIGLVYSTKGNDSKSWLLSTLGERLSKSGLLKEQLFSLFEKSIEVANSINSEEYKSKALSEIIVELSKGGLSKEQLFSLFEKSIEVAKSISDNEEKSEALSKIAKELSKSGMFEKSLEVANSISDSYDKSKALSTIAIELSKRGLFEKSMEIAKSLSYQPKSFALSTIAIELSKRGLFEKSIEVTKSINGDHKYDNEVHIKSSTLSTIVEELSKSELSKEQLFSLFEKSLEVANSINYERYKSEALSTIASGLSKSDFKERSKEVFEKSIEVASSIRDPDDKSKALSAIYAAQKRNISPSSQKQVEISNQQPLEIEQNTKNPIVLILQNHFSKTSISLQNPSSINISSEVPSSPNLDWKVLNNSDVDIDITNIQTTSLKWIADYKSTARTISKNIKSQSKRLGFDAEKFLVRCTRDGIDLGVAPKMLEVYQTFLNHWERDEALRQRYRKLFGVPEDDITKWYGTIQFKDSNDPCVVLPYLPTLSDEAYKKGLSEIEQLETDVVRVKALKKRAIPIGLDTTNWVTPYQIETWTKEIEAIEGREQRAKELFNKAKNYEIDLSNSFFDEVPINQRPYRDAALNHLDTELQRIDTFIDSWKEEKRKAKRVGYYWGNTSLKDVSKKQLSFHKKYIPTTTQTRNKISKIRFVRVNPGDFETTGSEKKIRISCPYYIATTELTKDIVASLQNATPSNNSYPWTGTLLETEEIIEVLSRQMGKKPCKDQNDLQCQTSAFRLPSVDEWKYAAAARRSYVYSGSNVGDEVSWNVDNADKIMPVGLKRPNAWGLYDMSGNVSEFAFRTSNYALGGSVTEKAKCGLIEGVSCDRRVSFGTMAGLRLVYSPYCSTR